MAKDFIPQSWSAFADWFQNFYTQLVVLAAKYGVTDKLPQLERDNSWVGYWVGAKVSVKQQEKQLTDYIDAVTRGELGSAPPSIPEWGLPASQPANVPPGIKARVREVAAIIKAQKSIYTTADGNLLGIISPEEAGLTEADFTPSLKLRSLNNYGIEADFRKFRLDALRIEYRHKGGDWMLAAVLTTSPGVFNIPTITPGSVEQVEIRAVFFQNNKIYGNYSPTYTVVIQP